MPDPSIGDQRAGSAGRTRTDSSLKFGARYAKSHIRTG